MFIMQDDGRHCQRATHARAGEWARSTPNHCDDENTVTLIVRYPVTVRPRHDRHLTGSLLPMDLLGPGTSAGRAHAIRTGVAAALKFTSAYVETALGRFFQPNFRFKAKFQRLTRKMAMRLAR